MCSFGVNSKLLKSAVDDAPSTTAADAYTESTVEDLPLMTSLCTVSGTNSAGLGKNSCNISTWNVLLCPLTLIT